MTSDKMTIEQMELVLGGGVTSLPAAPGEVIRVRMVNGSLVIDKITQENYNKRYGVAGEGGSVVPTSDPP